MSLLFLYVRTCGENSINIFFSLVWCKFLCDTSCRSCILNLIFFLVVVKLILYFWLTYGFLFWIRLVYVISIFQKREKTSAVPFIFCQIDTYAKLFTLLLNACKMKGIQLNTYSSLWKKVKSCYLKVLIYSDDIVNEKYIPSYCQISLVLLQSPISDNFFFCLKNFF